jgi:hypothetical protein
VKLMVTSGERWRLRWRARGSYLAMGQPVPPHGSERAQGAAVAAVPKQGWSRYESRGARRGAVKAFICRSRLAGALASVLFALACLLAPLQTAFPSGTGEGHHHVISHADHHDHGGPAISGDHGSDADHAPDQGEDPDPSAADQDSAGHSHPVNPAMLASGERQPWATFSVPVRREAASARAGPSLPSAPPSRPPDAPTISV